ncbi:MAG: helix-turn-helix transcriptional regulator [Hyphomicrobiaceae bacterium]
MPANQISHFRNLMHLNQEELGDRVGLTKYQVSRLENGKTELTVAVGRRIARVLGITLDELAGNIEDGSGFGFSDEMVPYIAGLDDKFGQALSADNLYPYTIDTDALDRAGFPRGIIVRVSDAATVCRAVQPLQAVRVLYHPPGSPTKAVSLFRLFVPPALLITNSSVMNLPAIDMDKEDAHIVGVVREAVQRYF